MGLLQRYVLREMTSPLLLGLIVFTFVFLAGQLFQLGHLLAGSTLAASLALQLIGCLVPGVLLLTAPMGLLVATLLAVGRLAADREIIAMKACGVHPFHLLWPILFAGSLLTGTLLAASMTVVPALNLRAADLALQLEFRILSALPANRPIPMAGLGDGQQQATFFFEERDSATGDMIGVTLRTQNARSTDEQTRRRLRQLDRDLAALVGVPGETAATSTTLARLEKEQLVRESQGVEALTVAARGSMAADLPGRMILMKLTSGTIQILQNERPEEPWNIRFGTLEKGFQPQFDKSQSGQFRKRPREMGQGELVERMAGTGSRANAARVEFWQRISVPLACIVMPLLAFPLGMTIRPQGKLLAYAVAFAVILVYYGLLNLGVSVGRGGSPYTGVAMLAPNAILGIIGFVLCRRLLRQ